MVVSGQDRELKAIGLHRLGQSGNFRAQGGGHPSQGVVYVQERLHVYRRVLFRGLLLRNILLLRLTAVGDTNRGTQLGASIALSIAAPQAESRYLTLRNPDSLAVRSTLHGP